MHAPERAPADTLALPDARPAITLGEALPFALAFEARRRQAADRRAARKLDRLKRTLRQCGELRARLAALCDAATAAAASGGDGEDARDDRIGRNAARELMLDAARGASRARGEPREGKPVFEPENRCAACEARAREASLSFAFVREARAFRLAELALSEDPDREDSRPVGSTDKTHAAAFQWPRLERKTHSGLSAEKRATAMLRGADDPPALFAAGTFLLTLVQTSAPDDGGSFSSREEPAFCLSRHDDHDANGRDVPTGSVPASDGDDKKVAEGYADVPTRDGRVVPRVVDAEEKKIPARNRKRDALNAKKAEARVVAAARGFARSLEHAARTSVSPQDGSSLSPSSQTFFTRDVAAASDALRRDVVASLLAAAAPVASPGREENVPTDFHCWSASSAAAVTSARLSRVALAEVADTDVLAGDVLVVCATRIREGVLALRERRRRVTEETEQTAPSAGFFFRATETEDAESRPEEVSDEKKNARFREQNDRHDDRHDDRHYATRASQTLDEFGECQRLGFVFSVAERAAQRLRVSHAETNVLSAAETRDSARNAAFARAGLDAARAAAEAATAPDPAEPHESVALRLIGSRAIRLHAMVCVALGRRAPGTRA
jgi:hypothetical protein